MNAAYPIYDVPRDSLPGWAIKGRAQFQNQHAGPAETAKNVLTHFSAPAASFRETMDSGRLFSAGLTPSVVWDWTNKLSDAFLDEMAALGKTLIQIPWSVGFSEASEAVQREVFVAFMEKARRRGIETCAYLSLRNIFWKDAFAHEPFLRDVVARHDDGSPVLYGYYQARYMACLEKPAWLDYLGRKSLAAIDAGVGHLYYDNLHAQCGCADCVAKFAAFTESLIGRALPLPPSRPLVDKSESDTGRDLEISRAEDLRRGAAGDADAFTVDYLYRRFAAKQIADALTALRDRAFARKYPLGFSANNHLAPFINDACNIIYSQDTALPGKNWNNIHVLRHLEAECQGWKQQTTNHQLNGADPRLSMAEAFAFQGYPYCANHLPYNRFYAENPDLFTEVETVAKVGVFMEWPNRLPHYLQALGETGILYEALSPDRWELERLKRFKVLLSPDMDAISDALWEALEGLKAKGVTVIATGQSGAFDAFARPRFPNVIRRGPDPFAKIDPAVLDEIRVAAGPEYVEIAPRDRVVVNLTKKRDQARYLVHLVNYREDATGPLRVKFNFPDFVARSATLYSPDAKDRGRSLAIDNQSAALDTMNIYSVIAIA